MPSQGLYNKGFVSAIQLMDAREIMPQIVDQARDRQFIDIARLIGRTLPTKVPIYHNHVNEDVNVVGVVNSVTSGSGSATVVAVLTEASSGVWRKGNVVRVNGKNALVTNVATTSNIDTLTLKSANGSNLTVAGTNKITFSTLASGEGANPVAGVRYKTTPYSNKVQIIEHFAPVITDIQGMSKQEITGKGIWGYQRDQDILMMKKAISGALISGQGSVTLFSDGSPALTDSDGNPVQLTSGLDEQVATYGGSRNATTTGVITLADIAAREDALIARKAPKDFMVIGSTAAMRPYSTFLKNLGSSGITSGRINIDGKEVDLTVEKYSSVGGFKYDFAMIDTFDDPTVYPSGVVDIAGSLYYIPKDAVALVGGGTQKRFTVRYMQNTEASPLTAGTGPNVRWEDMICEKSWGGLAPNPTAGDNKLYTKWTSYQGLELLGVRHFFKEGIIF